MFVAHIFAYLTVPWEDFYYNDQVFLSDFEVHNFWLLFNIDVCYPVIFHDRKLFGMEMSLISSKQRVQKVRCTAQIKLPNLRLNYKKVEFLIIQISGGDCIAQW